MSFFKLFILVISFFPFSLCQASIAGENMFIITENSISNFADRPGEKFNPHSLSLLDQKGRNFLFRSNLPEVDEQFEYDGLTASVATYLAHSGIELSPDYFLIDFSFLNYITEAKEVDAETRWFSENKSKGCLCLNSLYGSLQNPTEISKELRDFYLLFHDIDGLKRLMQGLKTLLDTPMKQDCVICFHCNNGKDRSGEAEACYLMHFKGYSYDEAVKEEKRVAGRALHPLTLNAIRWYAFYLRDIENMDTISSIDGK